MYSGYCELLPFLGLHKVFDGNDFVYHVGGQTALCIQRSASAYEDERFVQSRVGLQHLCLRARSRDDVDKAAAKLREMGAKIDRGPMEREWAPGYHFVVFEDPDGIRLETNHIPDKGLLAGETPAAPTNDPRQGPEPMSSAVERAGC
ncbi:MAG: VOC family protein [Gammaproteobacteria bacterium]|nr:VOC family protein [Gammaproteobacteria bacterium]